MNYEQIPFSSQQDVGAVIKAAHGIKETTGKLWRKVEIGEWKALDKQEFCLL